VAHLLLTLNFTTLCHIYLYITFLLVIYNLLYDNDLQAIPLNYTE